MDRLCRECSVKFLGGPRAYYCPGCRIERKRRASRECKARQRQGLVRQLGSEDICERCEQTYTVRGPLQRFCPVCQPIHAAEHDRDTALVFYHANKQARKIKRQTIARHCDECGKYYNPAGTKRLTCSAECQRIRSNRLWTIARKKRK